MRIPDVSGYYLNLGDRRHVLQPSPMIKGIVLAQSPYVSALLDESLS
jgi:hypothetical protein